MQNLMRDVDDSATMTAGCPQTAPRTGSVRGTTENNQRQCCNITERLNATSHDVRSVATPSSRSGHGFGQRSWSCTHDALDNGDGRLRRMATCGRIWTNGIRSGAPEARSEVGRVAHSVGTVQTGTPGDGDVAGQK